MNGSSATFDLREPPAQWTREDIFIPDEVAHLLRAEQVSRGIWLGQRVDCAAAPDPGLCRLSDDVAFGVVPGRATTGGMVEAPTKPV